jgi:hypothetical protein
MSLVPYRSRDLRIPERGLSTPGSTRVLRRESENAVYAARAIQLRGLLAELANEIDADIVTNATECFGRTMEAMDDVVRGTRAGDCRLRAAAFADGMTRALAMELESNVHGFSESVRREGLRPFDANLPRSVWERLAGY